MESAGLIKASAISACWIQGLQGSWVQSSKMLALALAVKRAVSRPPCMFAPLAILMYLARALFGKIKMNTF